MQLIIIKGTDDLERLGRALRQIGDQTLRREALRAIRQAASPLRDDVRASARATLPRAGGLADQIAACRISTLTRLSGKQVGVRIVAKSRNNVRSLDRGRLRHPLYGNRDHWFSQHIPLGWFSTPIWRKTGAIRVEISDALDRAIRRNLPRK